MTPIHAQSQALLQTIGDAKTKPIRGNRMVSGVFFTDSVLPLGWPASRLPVPHPAVVKE